METPPESDRPDSARLWRCDTCGKWSHAKRQPSRHVRWVKDRPAEGVVIISHNPGYDGVEGPFDFMDPSDPPEVGEGEAWEVRCGPFSAWTATRDGAA